MGKFPYKIESCVWELTRGCNMRCLHCGPAAGRPRQWELTLPECLHIAEQLVEQHCRQVTLVGGEVLLYEGWEKIARRLSDGRVSVRVTTNGFLSGQRQIDQLRHARPAVVYVAIDGMQSNHNRLRRVPGSFDRAMELLRLLVRKGFRVGVITNLMKFNVKDLPALYDMLVEEGVQAWQIQLAGPAGAMVWAPSLQLRPRRIPEVTRFIAARAADGRMSVCAGDEIGYFDRNEPMLRGGTCSSAPWRGCQAGLRVVGIDSTGNVKGCHLLDDNRFVEGNLRTQTLDEIWRSPTAFVYNRRFHTALLEGKCSGCDKGDICRAGCRSLCFFATGRLYDNPNCCYHPEASVRLVARKKSATPPVPRTRAQTHRPVSHKPTT